MHDVKKGDEPFDRLTGLCREMTKPLDGPENDDVKAVVFLQDGVSGGIQTYGYDDTGEAIGDVLVHLKAMFRASGSDLQLMTPDGVFLMGDDA